jgi:hypothetical protein
MGTLRPETSTPMSALTSAATVGSLEFWTSWQHWGVLVVEPEPPSFGVGTATARVATNARVKSLANMAVVGEAGGGSADASAGMCVLLSWGGKVEGRRLLYACAPTRRHMGLGLSAAIVHHRLCALPTTE